MNRLQKDIQLIIEKKELFTVLKNSTVLITGATGFIGSMLVKTLHAADKKYNLGIKILGHIRNTEKAKSVFGSLYSKVLFVNNLDVDCDYIVHTVSPTGSKIFIEHPVETIKASVLSTVDILELARKNNAAMVYLSSMEQYGLFPKDGQIISEEEAGIIDHLNIRSSYSESKRLCECLCASYASEYNVMVKIARLSQTFGAGISLADNRMPMQFAKSAIEGRDIILHTEGKSFINFVYVSDAITGILTILMKGIKGQAYNVCNDTEGRNVYEIAQMVSEVITDNKISVIVEKTDKMGYAPDTHFRLDSQKLRKLGWEAEVGLTEAYQRLVEYLKD